MQNLQPFQEIMTDRPTDQPTSQPPDRPTNQETDIGGHMDKSSTKLLASLAAQNEKKYECSDRSIIILTSLPLQEITADRWTIQPTYRRAFRLGNYTS